MSAIALASAQSARRPRVALILFFWFAAASLVAGQYLLLRGLFMLDRSLSGIVLVPSPWWRLSGMFVPLLAAGTALVLQRRWLEGIWSELATVGLILFVPFAAICLLLAHYVGLRALEAAHVPGGRTVTLALDEGMTDIGFVLVEDVDPAGFVWREVSELDDIEDGPFAHRPHLAATPDGRWLLVRRGGIWTDAFRLNEGHPAKVEIALPPAPAGQGEEAFMRLRSARIESLTGLRP